MKIDQDISNWLEFYDKLNKDDKKDSKKRKREDNQNGLNELRLTGLENLYSHVKEQKLTGRNLTNFLTKLEFTFRMTKEYIKKDKNNNNSSSDDYMILLLLALCSVMIELIQDIKLESYEKGRKFNVVKYLEKSMEEISKNHKPFKLFKLSFGQVNDAIKKNKLENNKKQKEEEEEEQEDEVYEEFSENETSEEEEVYDNNGYVKDGFVVDDDYEDEDYDPYEDYEEYEEEEEEEPNYEEIINNSNSNNKKLNKKFLEEFNKFSEKYRNSSEKDIEYYCAQDKKVREEFLNKMKEINNSEITEEPILFKLINLNIPKDQKNHIINNYFSIVNSMHDNNKLKTWLNNVLKIPFGKYMGTDLKEIKKKDVTKFMHQLKNDMDSAVWGHEEAKRTIIQMMGQKITNPDSKGNVLGIWGPPGNGKTTLIKEGIAKAMNKPFVFISLGGAGDASFLDGHSYTYEGSVCGRIARGLMESKCMNPIIYFDELDKISTGSKGEEITNLLVHLIDPVQNSHFRDKYFHGIDLDLSKVTFIFSFNEPHNVNHILMDRIKTVETKYLLPVQKLHIAKNYMLPKIFEDIGINESSIQFPDSTINSIINKYTYEGGVRKMKTVLYSICRELNVRNMMKSKFHNRVVKFPFKVKSSYIKELVKEYREIDKEKIHDEDKIGIVNGMWAGSSGVGGILSIETMFYPSKSLLETKTTGSLEKVIKESIEVACSLAWSRLDEKQKVFWMNKWKDKPEGFHVHCPDGATPKDGPSAGAAITLAIYSLLTDNKVRHDVSMTGEINLKGKVTKIGGLEEKLQGAKFAGVKLALVPKENEKDLLKIKERNSKLLDSNFKVEIVENFDDVLSYALA